MDTSAVSFNEYLQVTLCNLTRLPRFEDFEPAKESTHYPVLKVWRCWYCGGVHVWSAGCYADSNGSLKAGVRVPQYVLDFMVRPEMRETVTRCNQRFMWIGPLELKPKSRNGIPWFKNIGNAYWVRYVK